jgi:hypothetical protein
MKKLILILIISVISLFSCSSWEERAQNAECSESDNNYVLGKQFGQMAGIAKDGKRNCQWAKDAAIESDFTGLNFKNLHPQYNDCWCQGYLDGFEEGRFLKNTYKINKYLE